MTLPDQPQVYLITPPAFDVPAFGQTLARVLDDHPVACVRLALASGDEDIVARAADTLREITHARDVALVISDHIVLAQHLGLDGVHLSDPSRPMRQARALGLIAKRPRKALQIVVQTLL